MDTVLKTLYLLFNEGYFSSTNSQVIRKDLCAEAVRLTFILTENKYTNTKQTKALLALMCFQSSRFDARINNSGEAVLFEEQDRNLWNTELIEKGNYYLVMACNGDAFSKYHLEAAIAYWHTAPPGDSKWTHILDLYNELILIEYSPVTAINRVFAFGKVHGNKKAVQEAERSDLDNSSYYHALLGYLYAGLDTGKAIGHYQQAIMLTRSGTEKQTLSKEIRRLNEARNAAGQHV